AISQRTFSSPTRRSTISPSRGIWPSNSIPSSTKNAFTASRSSTTMRTLSIRLSVIFLLPHLTCGWYQASNTKLANAVRKINTELGRERIAFARIDFPGSYSFAAPHTQLLGFGRSPFRMALLFCHLEKCNGECTVDLAAGSVYKSGCWDCFPKAQSRQVSLMPLKFSCDRRESHAIVTLRSCNTPHSLVLNSSHGQTGASIWSSASPAFSISLSVIQDA